MSLDIDIQRCCTDVSVPPDADLRRWARAAATTAQGELVVRIVDETESASLNQQYRGKPGATNVLSFGDGEARLPEEVAQSLPYHLGDLVICAPVVAREAREQGKAVAAHWAHMLIHGLLHLQGYDHEQADQAREMEAQEIAILAQIGYPDPYEMAK